MEIQMEPKKRKNSHPNRILLSMEALGRVDRWIEEVQKAFKGTKLSRADVVNHILLGHSPTLSTEEVRKFGLLTYDEIRFATWALTALKEKRAKGENVTLRELLEHFGTGRPGEPVAPEAPKSQRGE